MFLGLKEGWGGSLPALIVLAAERYPVPMGKDLSSRRPMRWLRALFTSKEARLLESLRKPVPGPDRGPRPAALIEKGEEMYWTLR